jgi:hypothetical protein
MYKTTDGGIPSALNRRIESEIVEGQILNVFNDGVRILSIFNDAKYLTKFVVDYDICG